MGDEQDEQEKPKEEHFTPFGKGKYDSECGFVREITKAEGAAVIVMHGDKGSGFSVQAPMELQKALPATLRFMADQIERSVSALAGR